MALTIEQITNVMYDSLKKEAIRNNDYEDKFLHHLNKLGYISYTVGNMITIPMDYVINEEPVGEDVINDWEG